ncbi:hypothetical protein WSM22_26310 [Cytophagales bacterium WSM2-2]|nr:hypothetical protein WSM22_26310 [Cytophagales bacterium WSM2-2]
MNTITDRIRKFEISAVVLTVAGKFIFADYLNWKLPYDTIAILSWTLYVVKRKKQIPGIAKYWGFRTDNIKKVTMIILPYGVSMAILCFVVGIYRDTINITWHIIPILILYPIWGTVQQFLLMSLTSGNLNDLSNSNLNKGLVVLVSAVLFGIIHYPYTWLMIGTFVLAIFYGFVYLKEKNLYVLGVFHGWLGAILFYTVVGRDPFNELIGKVF